jgi:hypothetical protein
MDSQSDPHKAALRGSSEPGAIPRGARKENTMIKVLPESKGNILVLRAVAKLTDQDYKEK